MERLLGINLYVAFAVLLIVTGSIVAFIAVLGSFGAYKEVRSMLKSYFVIFLAFLAVTMTIGTLCFIFQAELDDRLQREMFNSMKLYGNDSHVTEAWDSMQINVSTFHKTDGLKLIYSAEIEPNFESGFSV